MSAAALALSPWPARPQPAPPPPVAAPVLAYNALVGVGRWLPRGTLGSFPVRFPSTDSPGDDGWHVDASFPGSNSQSYFDWRVNYLSHGRALLMLFLFPDVGETDGPA